MRRRIKAPVSEREIRFRKILSNARCLGASKEQIRRMEKHFAQYYQDLDDRELTQRLYEMMREKNPEFAEAIEYYRKLGFSVIDLGFQSKYPKREWKQRQQRKASLQEIKGWIEEPLNIGVVTGLVSGNLAVLDFDDPKIFETFFPKHEELKKNTMVVKSSKGIHVYLKSDKPVDSFKIPELKLDIKGEGGYVVAPPSIHPSGVKYEIVSEAKEPMLVKDLEETIWKRAFELGVRRNIVLDPEWKSGVGVSYAGLHPPCIQKLLEGVSEGMRNEAALRILCYFLNFRREDPKKTWGLIADWNPKNTSPLIENELKNIFESAEKGGYNYGCIDSIYRKYCQQNICEIGKSKISTELLQKAEEFLRDPNILQRFDKSTDKWIDKDYSIRRLCYRVYISALTDDPINQSLLGRDSIGKTYNAVTVAHATVPEEAIWFLGGLSPTALAHDYGEYDKNNRCFIVDLSHRIMLFLEPPHPATLEKLKPILSHDRKEITFKFTDRSKGGQLRTITAKVRGWPACLLCAAKTGFTTGEQTVRWMTATPEISQQKTREAMEKLGEIMENPGAFGFDDDEDVKTFKTAYKILKKTAPIKVKIPYAKTLARHTIIRGPQTTRTLHFFYRLIKANAAIYAYQREKTEDGFIVATPQDFIEVLNDFKEIIAPTVLGISQDALNLYKNLPNETLTADQIENKAKETIGETSRTTLKELYINRLIDAGLLTETQDPEDKRKTLYRPIKKTIEIQMFDDENAVISEIKSRSNIMQKAL